MDKYELNDLKVYCVHGWQYYYKSTHYKSVLAHVIGEDGEPVACERIGGNYS